MTLFAREYRHVHSAVLTGLFFLVFIGSAYADQNSAQYGIPFDVNNAGGADVSKSNVYLLSDSLGEPVVGFGEGTDYILNSGYRQPSASDFISVSCTDFVNLGNVIGTGQKTGSGTCTVYTDAYDGYRMVWQAGSNNRGGLVGHWKLDETSGTVAYDSSGNGNNGTHVNTPTIANDVPSRFLSTRSLSFSSASSEYVEVAHNDAVAISGPYSISVWVKSAGNSNYAFIAGKGDASDFNGYYITIDQSSGYPTLYNLQAAGYQAATVQTNIKNDNTWHHLGGTWDGTYLRLYLDGRMGVPVAASAPTVTTSSFRIGASNYPGRYFNGNIDDVRLYKRALSTEEIRDLASLAPPGSLTASGSQTTYIPGIFFPSTGGLVGHWKMEELFAGSTVADSSGYNVDGTVSGATGTNNLPQPTTNVPLKSNVLSVRSLNFDGTDDVVSISDSAKHRPAQISVSAWIFPNNFTSDWDSVLMKTTSTAWTDGYGLAHYNTANSIAFFINNYNTARAISTLTPDGAWHHVAGTYDLQNIKLYIDGSLVATTPYTTAITHSVQPLLIGKGGGGAYQFDGSIDDVRVYDRALTLAEIKGLAAEPQAWSVASTDAAWGGRLSSDSTDNDAKWGTDGGSEKWINVGDGTYTVVRRQTATPLAGSVEVMEFRGEVGTSKVQEAGTYQGVVTFTIVGY